MYFMSSGVGSSALVMFSRVYTASVTASAESGKGSLGNRLVQKYIYSRRQGRLAFQSFRPAMIDRLSYRPFPTVHLESVFVPVRPSDNMSDKSA